MNNGEVNDPAELKKFEAALKRLEQTDARLGPKVARLVGALALAYALSAGGYLYKAREWSESISELKERKGALESEIATKEQTRDRLERDLKELRSERDARTKRIAEYIQVRSETEPEDTSLNLLMDYKPIDEGATAASLWTAGFAKAEAGELDEARRLYRQALERDPKYVAAMNSLGVLALNDRKYDEARKYFEEAVATNGSYGPAVVNLGKVFALSGEESEAMVSCHRAEKLLGAVGSVLWLRKELNKYGLECSTDAAADRIKREAEELMRQEKEETAIAKFRRACELGNGKSCARLRTLCSQGVEDACKR